MPDLKRIGTAFSLRSNGISQSPPRTVHSRISILVMLIQMVEECHTLCLLITNRLALISWSGWQHRLFNIVFWVANPQIIYLFLFRCYCHGNWLNCRSRLHLYCSLTFILICRHSSGARKRQRTNQYCSLKHLVTPCALQPSFCEHSRLCSVSPRARDLEPEDPLPAASFSAVTLLSQAREDNTADCFLI